MATLRSPVADVAVRLRVDPEQGLTAEDAAVRLVEHGPNALPPPPRLSVGAVAIAVLRSPMVLMQAGVVVASFVLGNVLLAVVLLVLVGVNLTLAVRQELGARRAVDALAGAQTMAVRVLRDGAMQRIDAQGLVPGDVVLLEAGDEVPADGRVLAAAALEVQEAALTGESVPVPKQAGPLEMDEPPLAERANMLHSGTDVVRGTARLLVTATGSTTEIGRIAGLLNRVERRVSPLTAELQRLVTVFSVLAWAVVALIVAIGLVRGLPVEQLLLLAISVAVSAIPSGMPTFVQVILASAAGRLAARHAVVKDLGDVETLGATSQIVTDKTGTLTRNEMMVRAVVLGGDRFTVEGDGYARTGRILAPAGVEVPDLTAIGYALCLVSDATVSADGEVVGDPTEAAMVVLAGKLGIDETLTRAAYPRLAEQPFDSELKFMATWHRVPWQGADRVVGLVKGAPDVILARSSADAATRTALLARNEELAADGLRVLALAMRVEDDTALSGIQADPLAAVEGLDVVALIGMIDPLRPSTAAAVAEARAAGIDVRMATGDHAITGAAIGRELGLGAGAITGAEFQSLSDAELAERLDELHVIGRSTPDDKLRLVRALQARGEVVAMTGDAVNDAAGIKAADVGVAMGSGAEVTKQAARVILTDDDFGSLIAGIRDGRGTYDRIVAYVGFQTTTLVALVLLYLAASAFDIGGGEVMPPLMVVTIAFVYATLPVIMIVNDRPAADLMSRRPRDIRRPLASPAALARWGLWGAVLFGAGLVALRLAPDEPSAEGGSTAATMVFATLAIGMTLAGLSWRRTTEAGWRAPFWPPLLWAVAPLVVLLLSTELSALHELLGTVRLTPEQWLACALLGLTLPAVIEVTKAIRRLLERHRPASPAWED
ncbi:MAG TPA: cation-transporting P-type ATPase [Microbacteriaceae bacterium]|nr:cation-transporting P-type ATPase [Microbacteriaceae bacterium]